MTTQLFRACCALLLAAFACTAVANPLPIVSYAMQNGQSGSQTYFDDTYGGLGSSGNPNISGSPLSGGLGQLRDGVFADYTDIFDDDWVGWNNIQPTITIDLGAVYPVDTFSVHASNWSPPFNDVGVPGRADMFYSQDNVTYFMLGQYFTSAAERSGDESRWIDFPFNGISMRYVRVQLFDGTKAAGTSPGLKSWIFIDEIRADGTIPEPASALLAMSGLFALTFMSGRSRRE